MAEFYETEPFTPPTPESGRIDFIPLDGPGPLYEYWVGDTYGCAEFPKGMPPTVESAAELEPNAFAFRILARDAFGHWRIEAVAHTAVREA